MTRQVPRRPGLRGLALLETALATALLGLLAVVVMRALEPAQRLGTPADPVVDLQPAQDALLGQLLGSLHLPPPQAAAGSADFAGYVQGWLPQDALGMSASPRIRYLADASLTAVPAQMYQADPLSLTQGAVVPRSAPSALDVCLLLYRKQAGTAAGSGMAFAVQADVPQPGKPEGSSAVDFSPAAASPVLALGYGELLARMGCVQRFADLSGSVKGTASLLDMQALAELEYAMAQEMVVQAKAGLEWLQVGIFLKTLLVRNMITVIALLAIDAQEGPLAATLTTVNIVSAAAIMSAAATGIVNSSLNLKEARAAIPEVEKFRDDVGLWRARVQASLQDSIRYANELQKAGLQP